MNVDVVILLRSFKVLKNDVLMNMGKEELAEAQKGSDKIFLNHKQLPLWLVKIWLRKIIFRFLLSKLSKNFLYNQLSRPSRS
jgi:hypothetical protein